MSKISESQLLVESLLTSSLLVEKLDNVEAFDRNLLTHFTNDSLIPQFSFQQKLGHLYEDVLEYLLRNSSNVEFIKRSLQVYRGMSNGGKQTLGEFDFLIRTQSSVTHVELATKFYLQVENGGVVTFPGPDARDNWERKRLRMLEHQFGIGNLPEAKELLSSEYEITDYEVAHLIYGCLFHHASSSAKSPTGVSPTAHWGKWLRGCEWDNLLGNKNVWFMPKYLWPCTPSEQMLTVLEETTKEVMIAKALKRCVMFTDGVDRYFLVSPQWLELTHN